MRVIDHRYRGERRRFDLAVRMIGHEARTQTIRMCTGLSDDRIRKLYRTYFQPGGRAKVKRHRGKSPRQPSYFTRNPRNQLETTIMATLLCTAGLVEAKNRRETALLRGNLEHGILFCLVYESYLSVGTPAPLSFEHAWFLVEAIHSGTELGFTTCQKCRLVYVHDALALKPKVCPSCRIKDQAPVAANSKLARGS